MPQQIDFEGQTHEFPDDFSTADIQTALASMHPKPYAAPMSMRAAGAGDTPAPSTPPTKSLLQRGMDWAGSTWNDFRNSMGPFGHPVDAAMTDVHGIQQGGVGYVADQMAEGAKVPLRLAKRQLDTANTAVDEFGKGHLASGLADAIYANVPVVGPQFSEAGHDMDAGKPWLGKALAAGVNTALMTPEGAGAAADATGAVVRGTMNTGKAALRKTMYPNADRMVRTPASATENPAEAFTPLEVQQAAKSHGVDMTSGELLGGGIGRGLQNTGEKSAFGSNIVLDHKSVAQGKMYKVMHDTETAASPTTPDAASVGNNLYTQVNKAAQAARTAADKDYADWRAGTTTGTIDVDFSDINKKYGDLYKQQSPIWENIPEQQASTLRGMAGKAKQFGHHVEDEDFGTQVDPVVDLDMAKEMRSHWLDAKRELVRRGRADSREAGLVTGITTDIDSAMEAAIRRHGSQGSTGTLTAEQADAAGQTAVDAWRKANGSYKAYVDKFHGDDSVLSQILDSGELDRPKLADKLLSRSAGGNTAVVDQLRNAGVDLGPLRRTVANEVTNRGFGTPRNRLGGWTDDFLQKLYADKPEELRQLYINSKIGRALRMDPNVSGSGTIMSQTGDVEASMRAAMSTMTGNPLTGLDVLTSVPGAKVAAAKLAMSPRFNRWQTGVPGKTAARLLRPSVPGEKLLTPGGPGSIPIGGEPGGGRGNGGNSPTGPVTPETTESELEQARRQGKGDVQPTLVKTAPVDQAAADAAWKQGVESTPLPKPIEPTLVKKAAKDNTPATTPDDPIQFIVDKVGPEGLHATYTDEGLRSALGLPTSVSLRTLEDNGFIRRNNEGLWGFGDRLGIKADDGDLSQPTRKNASTEFNFGANRRKRKMSGENPNQPEGPAKEGTGPGAMLARGTKLMPHAGPQTGPVMYHGTPSENVPSILKRGLEPTKPDYGDRGVWLTTNPDEAALYARYNKWLPATPVEPGAVAQVDTVGLHPQNLYDQTHILYNKVSPGRLTVRQLKYSPQLGPTEYDPEQAPRAEFQDEVLRAEPKLRKKLSLATGGHETTEVPAGGMKLKSQADAVYAKIDADPNYKPTADEQAILEADAAQYQNHEADKIPGKSELINKLRKLENFGKSTKKNPNDKTN